MKYENIVKAKFISRPNRFIARVEIDGEEVISHVKNTGRCRELLVPGATVYLEDFRGRMGSRKLRYSLIAVEKQTPKGLLLINMDSQAPNKVAAEALTQGLINIPGLGKLKTIRPETVYGSSRFDFGLEDEEGRKGFMEVKGCTLEENGEASFPDAPTERGVKHLEELIKAKKAGYAAAVLFVIQMEGMDHFVPADDKHPAFGDALRKAMEHGVSVSAMECRVSPDTLEIARPIEVRKRKTDG